MTITSDTPTQADADLARLLDAQHRAYRAAPYPTEAERLDRLDRLRALLADNGPAIADAIAADFGHRPAMESRVADLAGTIGSIDHTKRHLRKWMKRRRRSTAMWFQPAANAVIAQPKGVIGVMAPWNYPVNLALVPAATAMAAGNRVIVRMSEFTPTTTALLTTLVGASFTADELTIVGGDVELATAFAALPFDHLVFTGSTRVGRSVMQAAAANLTPVTLELGGKSPAIISPDYPIEDAATRIVWGKTFNAGQTCIAPDYVLLPEERVAPFIDAATLWFESAHGRGAGDYTTIINDRAHQRAQALVDDAAERGATVITTKLPGDHHPRHFPLTFIVDPPAGSRVLSEEIFGPILPLVPAATVVDGITYANERDRPLAAYIFSNDQHDIDARIHEAHLRRARCERSAGSFRATRFALRWHRRKRHRPDSWTRGVRRTLQPSRSVHPAGRGPHRPRAALPALRGPGRSRRPPHGRLIGRVSKHSETRAQSSGAGGGPRTSMP